MRRHAGFSLLELLVVLSLMAMVYGMVLPMISAALPGTELKGAARQIASGLRKARSVAVTQKQPALLTLDIAQRQFTVSGDNQRYALPKDIQIVLDTTKSEVLTDSAGSIRFYPDGSSTGGRISLASGSKKYDVNVDWITGHVAVVTP